MTGSFDDRIAFKWVGLLCGLLSYTYLFTMTMTVTMVCWNCVYWCAINAAGYITWKNSIDRNVCTILLTPKPLSHDGKVNPATAVSIRQPCWTHSPTAVSWLQQVFNTKQSGTHATMHIARQFFVWHFAVLRCHTMFHGCVEKTASSVKHRTVRL